VGLSKAFGKKSFDKPHLVRSPGGLANEIKKVRRDVDAAFFSLEKGGVIVKFFTQVPTNVVNANGIKTTFASSTSSVVLTGTDFDGILAPGTGSALIKSPKRVTLTVSSDGTPAHWTGGNLVFTGADIDGKAISETVASSAGAGTTTTVNYFARLDSVSIPAQGGTLAQLTLGVAADDANIASLVASTSAQILDTNAEFNRARVGNRPMPYGRRISFIFGASADWITSNITIEGLDVLGKRISETIAVPNGGNGTVNTTKFYAQVLKISVPAQGGNTGTATVGFLNAELGLDVNPLSDVEAVCVIREANDPGTGVWAVPSAGAVDPKSVTNSEPYGRYIPNVAPDGIRSYVIAYLPSPS
jgi:hypothetical protein